MNDGRFVDDQIVNMLIEEILSDPQKKNRLIFDGYPRSLTDIIQLSTDIDDSPLRYVT